MHLEAIFGLSRHQTKLLEAGIRPKDVCNFPLSGVMRKPFDIYCASSILGVLHDRGEVLGCMIHLLIAHHRLMLRLVLNIWLRLDSLHLSLWLERFDKTGESMDTFT